MKVVRSVSIALVGLAAARALSSVARGRKPGGEKPRAHKSALSGPLVRGFTFVNRHVEWHRLPTPLAVLNLLAYRIELREKNLHKTESTAQVPTNGSDTHARDPRWLYWRTVEGTHNDLTDVGMGRAGARFGRNVPIKYTHPEPEPALLSPNPRIVSQKLLARDTFKPATTLNVLAAAWIQFMVHDWFNHGKNQFDNTISLELEKGDPWFERPMRIPRTAADPSRTPEEADRPPTYSNVVSHWWDASSIYGCDDETCARVRSEMDGKLVVENGRLPTDPETGLSITGFNDNWWVGLGLLHTLFTLEHNAICDRLKQEYPHWTDERLFHTARLVNSALMAKIHTVEWTTAILGHPALQIGMRANWWGLATEKITNMIGRIGDSEVISGIPGSPTEHHGVPFALTEEFAAVYRLHPLIPDDYEIYSLNTGELLKKLTFPEVANRNAATVVDDKVSVLDTLYSFGIAHPGAVVLHNFPRFLRDLVTQDGVRVDLAATDIMRDRERGVPRYNQFRRLLHMRPYKTFEELTPNKQWQRELKEVYDNDIERADLMVGMYAETPPEGFGFSDTAFRIFILMASRRLKSDRFFTTDYNARVYTQLGLDWVRDNDMSSILLRHYPELAAPLRQVKNAFAPWPRVS
jgi:hypothetical protein